MLSEETVYQLWDDSTGDRIEVGPDSDGLGAIEIVQVSAKGIRSHHFFLTLEMAPKIAEMLNKAVKDHASKCPNNT